MIKRICKSVLRQTFVLLGLVTFVACSSEKDEIVDNPNFNKETGEVNTQFVFTISTGNETTRQSSGTVQANSEFRGIENVKIMTYKQTGMDGSHLYDESKSADKVFDLSTLLLSGQISESDQRRVIELSLPLNTNTMTFYGKAIKQGTERSNGSIEYNVSGNPDETYFKLKSRLENESLLTATVKLLESVFSRLVETGMHQETTGGKRDFRYAFSWPGESGHGDVLDGDARDVALGKLTKGQTSTNYTDGSNTIYVGSLDWKDLGEEYSKKENLTPLEEILGSTYCAFTGINDGEVRAGSTASVLRAVNDVMIANEKVALATPTSPAEKIAQLLGERLGVRFNTYFDHNAEGGLKFKDVSDVVESLKNYIGMNPDEFSTVTNTALAQFPVSLNLPMGAAQLHFDGANFTYANPGVTFGIDGSDGSDGTSLKRIMWPAELCYFGNSPLRASDVSKVQNDYPATVSEWRKADNEKWGDFKGKHVASTTRAVAMQNDINYGTALLQSTVTIVERYLDDNGKYFNEYEGNSQFDASNPLFALSGILIGGQNNEMGWNFIRKFDVDKTDDAGTETANYHSSSFNYVIYDNAVGVENSDGTFAGLDIPSYGGYTAPNYTLVFDNYSSASDPDAQSTVYVALELVNKTGKDFYGEQGLVRNGGTFYIVGKLDPSAAENKGDDIFSYEGSVHHPLPPYAADGSTIKAKRVFIQDYVTTAEFQIKKESLKHAFVTVPDLRATNISLGLSVDLKWQPGLNFKVDVGQ